MQLVNGNEIADRIKLSVKEKLTTLSSSVGKGPKLVSVMAGDDEEAKIYMNMQKKAAEEVGIKFATHRLKGDISQEDLVKEIAKLNDDREATAIIVQKPLPEGIDHDRVVASVAPGKDAEGIHPYNLGRILRREADIVPCTPGAVMKILRVHKIDLYGREVVIIGHSAIIGKPLSLMMLNEMATTTVCHIATCDKGHLIGHAKEADILVVAVGKAGMVRGDWVKEGAVVIDVGINKVGGRIAGDVEFSEVSKKASIITPVPGGVGPVTVSILMRNVLRAYRTQNVKG